MKDKLTKICSKCEIEKPLVVKDKIISVGEVSVNWSNLEITDLQVEPLELFIKKLEETIQYNVEVFNE